MVEAAHDGEPDRREEAAAGVGRVELGLEEVLGEVEGEPGEVAEDVHDHDDEQGHGRLRGVPAAGLHLHTTQHTIKVLIRLHKSSDASIVYLHCTISNKK